MRSTSNARRRGIAILAAALSSLMLLAAPAQAYTRTWTYVGEFKASLTSSTFNNTAAGEIKITVTASNCSSEWPAVTMQLKKQNSATIYGNYGTQKTISCGSMKTFTYPAAPTGTYKMYFARTGPTSYDENWKKVEGTVYYW